MLLETEFKYILITALIEQIISWKQVIKKEIKKVPYKEPLCVLFTGNKNTSGKDLCKIEINNNFYICPLRIPYGKCMEDIEHGYCKNSSEASLNTHTLFPGCNSCKNKAKYIYSILKKELNTLLSLQNKNRNIKKENNNDWD